MVITKQDQKINLTAVLTGSECWISTSEYEVLKRKKNIAWTDCQSEKEWLVKLHYLRTLLKTKKIEKDVFVKKEQRLILKWWTKFCMQQR